MESKRGKKIDDYKDILLKMTADGVTIARTPTFTDFLEDVELDE